ncbi:phospholipid N-methyltransferase PmtA [Phyllobacterium leguminum]|uniref:Phosphatidylethanolamine N-methyltransferase /phosphatidyl-N-methylethanolamine N-methyltransferase n=1 Tax=Phyllobacterium leguminum TaxID=314237 RepID=A0A318T8S3_9HYPH|nr:class I SAM-dependent methyltransferase [Phyllobacterium leguminum]PYE89179.1 phosphatidylethanolamine N-methyltransferase /phosphatidyl-N-methylethanolamine N-methyltransferase [Phyllobacterium leguminum]
MAGPFAKKLAEKFDEEIRFFKGWIDGPKAVGAILPTSSVTARRMASVVNPHSGLPVLELGPGTGVITRAILQRGVKPESLYCVEYSEDFARRLCADLPDINIIQGDAFDLDSTLGNHRDVVFDSVICAVPLLNFPLEKRLALLEDLLRRIPEGRPVMQITYSPLPAIPAGRGKYVVEPYDFVIRNVPPARLWVYKRGHS